MIPMVHGTQDGTQGGCFDAGARARAGIHLSRRLCLGGLTVIGLVPARAHSELRSTRPSNGAIVPSPDGIELVFNERVQMTTLRLRDGTGVVLRLTGEAGFAPQAHQRARVDRVLAPGPYTIEWAAISADGHPIQGSVRFVVRERE